MYEVVVGPIPRESDIFYYQGICGFVNVHREMKPYCTSFSEPVHEALYA